MLQCTEGLRSGCSLRLTVKCVSQVKTGRSRGVGMTKCKIRKTDLHDEVHQYCPQPASAPAMLPPPLRPPMGPCFCRVLISSLQTTAPRDLQV